VVGFTCTLLHDKDAHNLFKKMKGCFRLQKVKSFNIGNEHGTVIGLTQHGKTFATIKTLKSLDKPVLFFNTQHTPVGRGWVEATGHHSPDQIIAAIKKGHKINFLPSEKGLEYMSVQLGAITDAVFQQGRLDFYYAIDEVHLFKLTKKKDGHNALIRLATTGLGRGFKCLFLSQRPAMMDNTLYTQSTKHIVFALGMNDLSYLKTNGFPAEEIREKVKGEKYHFVEFDQKEVKGPYMVNG
jgi:hypothetical protein